jgi:glyoxylase-like metal-dependent hydrolase (beta-lactamase superfamily II)
MMTDTAATLMIGDIRARALVDLDGYAIPLSMIFPDLDVADIAQHKSWLEPTHVKDVAVQLVVRSIVMEVDGRRILIDSCVGEHKERLTRPAMNKRTDTGFIERLGKLGLKPGDIDVVLCTHLHVDHVGWNTKLDNGRWVPTFPNARYLFGRKELDYWMAQPDRAAVGGGSLVDSVVPIMEAKCCDLVDDGHDLGKGLSLCALPGHTPGQLGLDVQRGKDRAFFAGDAIHSPIQMLFPDISTGFDTDKAQARATRRAFLEAAAEDNRHLVPCHFRGPLGTRVKKQGGGYMIA